MLVGGILNFKINSVLQVAKGDFTYNLGVPKHEAVMSSSGTVAGFKVTPVVPFIEGEITDRGDFDVKALLGLRDGVITLELINGKVIVLSGAHSSSDGEVSTGEGSIKVRFEAVSAEEIKA